MKYLGLIVARSGSKGIIGKNLIDLNGKPLIQYTIEYAINALGIDCVDLSSDDDAIIELALRMGIKIHYKRPANLATDEANIIDVINFHLDWLTQNGEEFPNNIILFQPTSPIRKNSLVFDCVQKYEQSNSNSLIAVSESRQHPYEMFSFDKNKLEFISNISARRQDYPKYYFVTGSLYITSVEFIKKYNKLFNEDSSIFIVSDYEAIDIDDEFDLEIARNIIKKYGSNSAFD